MTTTPTPRPAGDGDPARLVEDRVLHAVEQDEREQRIARFVLVAEQTSLSLDELAEAVTRLRDRHLLRVMFEATDPGTRERSEAVALDPHPSPDQLRDCVLALPKEVSPQG